jgi:hypothetical protein
MASAAQPPSDLPTATSGPNAPPAPPARRRGRPRLYKDNAEKQRAHRERAKRKLAELTAAARSVTVTRKQPPAPGQLAPEVIQFLQQLRSLRAGDREEQRRTWEQLEELLAEAEGRSGVERKTVLLSGACGAGKTTAMRLIRRHFLPTLGETAVIDVDQVYTMVDPDYSIPFPEAESYWSLARRQCALLAHAYLSGGFGLVVIGGNSLYQKDRLNEILGALLAVSAVYHLTLDPDPEVIQRRIQARRSPLDAQKTPEWIDQHVRYMRAYYEPWTARIDNSALSPEETVQAIQRTILEDRGRLTQQFSF